MFDYEKAKSILNKHKIIKEMEESGIFIFHVFGDRIWFTENCDEYYGVILNADICKQIASAFLELSECFTGETK